MKSDSTFKVHFDRAISTVADAFMWFEPVRDDVKYQECLWEMNEEKRQESYLMCCRGIRPFSTPEEFKRVRAINVRIVEEPNKRHDDLGTITMSIYLSGGEYSLKKGEKLVGRVNIRRGPDYFIVRDLLYRDILRDHIN